MKVGDGVTKERAIEILDPNHREHYESIEPVNEACRMGMQALQKQIPTKPGKTSTGVTTCPSCNRFVDRHERKHGNLDIPHCKWCGQAIDWGVSDG